MNRERYPWIYDVLLLLVLVLAGYLRLTGVNWGEGQNQHPDENFLSGVLGSLRAHKCADPSIPIDACPPDQQQWLSIGDYLNSATSTLNPYNRGYSFYVYGDLPMTIVRVAVELSHQTDVKIIGRQFSALSDLFTILILYFIVSRLYDRRVALLSSLFSALAVMQIQQSHFFTTDLFVNPFAFLAIYFAVVLLDARYKTPATSGAVVEKQEDLESQISDEPDEPATDYKSMILQAVSDPLFLFSIGFGVAYGMALASKVNIFPLAVLLPGAFVLRYFIRDRYTVAVDTDSGTSSETAIQNRRSTLNDYWLLILACLIAGGLAAIISFRIFQPYAFDGLLPSKQWIANIQEQRVQAVGDADLPWNLQWAKRNHLYSFMNLTVWGLGLPLGILAWIGFLYMGWRILKGEWRHALLWGWTAAYFIWQSLEFNPTMRYQLPIYPLLAMMAGWMVFQIPQIKSNKLRNTYIILRNLVAVIAVALTAAWAFAFHNIYLNPEPRIAASRWIYQNVPGPINIRVDTAGGQTYNQPLPLPMNLVLQSDAPYNSSFIPQKDGTLDSIFLPHVLNGNASPASLRVILSNMPDPPPGQALSDSSAEVAPYVSGDARGGAVELKPEGSIELTKGTQYYLRLETDGTLTSFSGAAVANETDYDYGLPFRLDGYDAFGGLYRGDLNLQVYWDDNADKLDRFVTMLGQTDYIFIPTNHQYAQITRLPERYPLTTKYYRDLMGCPVEMNIIDCYYKAQPGNYQGKLGFDLVAVFEDYPRLGPIVINDQYAEEAFTFYDHPKVFIFKKDANFSADHVRADLGTVDLSKAVHLLPRQFSSYSTLMLSPDQLASQRAGGTWSKLFSYDWIQNHYPYVGLLIWYIFIFMLGLATYPIVRLAMPGLADKGYPLSRALGLVIFAYFAWLAGSVGLTYTRTTIAAAFVLLLAIGTILGYRQRAELREEWRTKRKYFLMAEGLFLTFFLIDLFIRIGNPDLWHPARGGERPMDFSYFNAILKSTSFPPYDPWFAGGYINYYYYGFVLVGTPVKLLGIVPTIAYNFILPTLFAMVGIGAFSIGWNILSIYNSGREQAGEDEETSGFEIQPSSLIAGLSASSLTILLGNLGTIQLLYQKLQQLGSLGAFSWSANLGQRLQWAFNGLLMTFSGATLPIGPGDWYWNPSRVIPPGPGNEITEFPLFTFLYSDLHAHMLVMPIALLVISWALSVLAARARWKSQAAAGLGFVIGGLIIGAVYPTNLSDEYTYLLIGMIALAYSIWRYAEARSLAWRIAKVVGAVAALYLLSTYLYEPYRYWYSQAYSALDPWNGPYTPIMSYLTHWGVFLFIVVSWLIWETHEWMAQTPLSALGKLKPYQLLIEGALVLFVIALLGLQDKGTGVGWIALPIAVWAGVLLLNPKMPDIKRFALFLIGTAMLITIVVEIVVVRGDIGRANTIFKFYLQAWLMLAVSSGAALAWLLPAFFKWLPGWRIFWQGVLMFLLAGAALFTVTGTDAKIHDRWVAEVPHSLDSITFMKYAQYDDFGQRLNLIEDYRAIRWMQDNVQGSPVIVEANCPEYHWCTRFTIYTGLPGVVGWNFHQRQQRVLTSQLVEARVAAVGDFYNSVDIEFTRNFLKTYNVKYIIVGQLERAEYTPKGIAKFDQYDGKYWKSIYHDGRTAIYQVLP